MGALRKFDIHSERHFTIIRGRQATQKEARLPLVIKMFASCSIAAVLFVFLQAGSDADNVTRAFVGILVSLVGTLAVLVYKDYVRRMQQNEGRITDVAKVLDDKTDHLERKIDKAIRAFTGLLVATNPDKASEIYEVSEAFFKED